jgi:molecular chaperone GrpE
MKVTDTNRNQQKSTPDGNSTADVPATAEAIASVAEDLASEFGGLATDSVNDQIQSLTAERDANHEKWLRAQAEFENYKRRTDTDSGNLVKFANERLILALLPIVNDFVRSLKAGGENKEYDAFYKGVELIHNNFMKVLEKEGLAAFDSVGKPFDVQYHDALMQLPKNGVEPNTVIEEIERGYKLNDKIIRHAKVIVSAPSAETQSETTKEEAKN